MAWFWGLIAYMGMSYLVAVLVGNLFLVSDECGSPTGYCACALCVRRKGVLCGVSDDWCIGFSFVYWLFGGCMVALVVVLFVPLLSFLAMPALCRFLRVTHAFYDDVLEGYTGTCTHVKVIHMPTIKQHDGRPRHQSQHPYAQGRTCAKQEQVQAAAPGQKQNQSAVRTTTSGQRTKQEGKGSLTRAGAGGCTPQMTCLWELTLKQCTPHPQPGNAHLIMYTHSRIALATSQRYRHSQAPPLQDMTNAY